MKKMKKKMKKSAVTPIKSLALLSPPKKHIAVKPPSHLNSSCDRVNLFRRRPLESNCLPRPTSAGPAPASAPASPAAKAAAPRASTLPVPPLPLPLATPPCDDSALVPSLVSGPTSKAGVLGCDDGVDALFVNSGTHRFRSSGRMRYAMSWGWDGMGWDVMGRDKMGRRM